ncbi:MAG: hypothetical protein ACYCXK_06175 [Candidatus Humimicrobiaceae bacterium]
MIDSFLYLWEIDKRTVIFVSHDIDESAYLGDEIFILNDSRPATIKKQIEIISAQKKA